MASLSSPNSFHSSTCSRSWCVARAISTRQSSFADRHSPR
jgi:hypothetical protein